MPRALAFALMAAALIAANPPPADAPLTPAAAPNSAIVGGHHIQPRASVGKAAPDAGISKRDADDVDRLYQELIRQTAPDATPVNGSAPPQ
ncbi:MAG TPA: hypothetical protein VKB68_20295 [Stellaceae bacterium]|nr:hypothetical protein [Stellaceae bacterium]